MPHPPSCNCPECCVLFARPIVVSPASQTARMVHARRNAREVLAVLRDIQERQAILDAEAVWETWRRNHGLFRFPLNEKREARDEARRWGGSRR